MNKYTSDEVFAAEKKLRIKRYDREADMLSQLYGLLRQEEEENRRDPVNEPKTGDRVMFSDKSELAWQDTSGPSRAMDLRFWKLSCGFESATIIRRQEMPQ